MWTNQERQRYNALCDREHAGGLSEDERLELSALIQRLEDHEATYLGPANDRKAAEVAELTAGCEEMEAGNARLREYLRERQAFLSRVERVAAELHDEDRALRERFGADLGAVGELAPAGTP